MKTKLTLEYDGTRFAGWARQPGLRTVQEELERALQRILGCALSVSVAGRTDRGVHAWGQVVSYAHEALDPSSLNAVLPDDVAVLSSEPVSEAFDARRSASSRTYCYRVLARRERPALERGRVLWAPGSMRRELLAECAAALIGRHDFTAFTPTEATYTCFHRRVHQARWELDGDELRFWIEAESFLRQMNRALVGTMLQVAHGRRDPASFVALLKGQPREQAGPTAPPHGLALARVSFQPEASVSSSRDVEPAADKR
ncbi:MAG: tRNA pseudouridine(38-40) synthase TruA [Solirubrobacteraceae bacterium]